MFQTEGGIFGERTLLNIDVLQAKNFGFLVPEEISGKDSSPVWIYFDEIIETEASVMIKIHFSLDKENYQEKSVFYKKDGLTGNNSLGIALAYLYKNDSRTIKDGEDAYRYLKNLIFGGDTLNSSLPYYLVIREGLRKFEELASYEKSGFYSALEYPDATSNFYYRLYLEEKNSFKRYLIAKKGYGKFPDSSEVTLAYARSLFRKEKYEDCIAVLERCAKEDSEQRYSDLERLQLLFESYVFMEKFDQAEELIKNVNIRETYRKIFFGYLNYRKENYSQAEGFFQEAIEDDLSHEDLVNMVVHLLLTCYVKQKNVTGVESLLNDLPLTDLWAYPFEIDAGEIAKKTLKEALSLKELGELNIAKIKGYLGVLYENSLQLEDEEDGGRKLTKVEVEKLRQAEKLLAESITFFPTFQPFVATYSDIFYRRKEYDKALEHRFKALEGENIEFWSSANATLAKCSQEFVDAYPEFLNKHLTGSSKERKYFQTLFESDIEFLWEQKRYDIIEQLYGKFKDLLDFDEIKENYDVSGGYSSFPLFEISYSLSNRNDKKGAKNLYEQYLRIFGESSSVLNNLALIYEEEKKLTKARKLIKSARILTGGKDEIVEKNYQRLILNSKKKTRKSSKKQTSENVSVKPQLKFDGSKGVIRYGSKECSVPFGTAEYYICESLFDIPFGNRVQESVILEKLDILKGKDENPRTVYDAHRRVNKKVEDSIGLNKLIEHGAACVWIREDSLNGS